ncbi:hypothetical protein CBR_g31142 [Chara braunii]|uniref:Uncharacterized protein n=1 Tax=Chara braunii TaxID=69332 RepID=A0A388LEN8_CHABU|nr:hypothetical protein CBR_g31142 [Chara braunii]|eukprot:GBG80683.1 hypothetical protein CBR_g31142 [Chara braunii]
MWARTSSSKGIWDKADAARRVVVAAAVIVAESRDEVEAIVVYLRDEVVDVTRRGVLVVAGSVADSRDDIVDVVGSVDVEGLVFVVVVAGVVVDVEAVIIAVVNAVRRVALVVVGSVANSRDEIVDVAPSDDVEAHVFVVDGATVVADVEAPVFAVVAEEAVAAVDGVAIVVFAVVVASIDADLEDKLVEDDSLDDAFGFFCGDLSSWAPARQEQMEREESRGKSKAYMGRVTHSSDREGRTNGELASLPRERGRDVGDREQDAREEDRSKGWQDATVKESVICDRVDNQPCSVAKAVPHCDIS